MAKFNIKPLVQESLWLVLYITTSLCFTVFFFYHSSRYFVPVTDLDLYSTALFSIAAK
jgi:hypothetical protein